MIIRKVFSRENAAIKSVMKLAHHVLQSCMWSIIYLVLKHNVVADIKQTQFLEVVYCKNSQDIIAGLPQFEK